MSFFKKEGEVIDFTLLQKRGIIKKPAEEKEVIDLTQNQNSNQSNQTSSPFDFMDSIAQASANNNINSTPNNSSLDSEISHLKIKLDDYEFKIRMLEDRIRDLEKRAR